MSSSSTTSPAPTLEQVARDRSAFDPVPSVRNPAAVVVARSTPGDADAVGIPVGPKGAVPRTLGVDRATLTAAGFEAKVGQTFVVPGSSDRSLIAIGIGDSPLTTNQLRDAAGAFARAAGKRSVLATTLLDAASGDIADAAAAVVEGALLARYRFESLKSADPSPSLASITLVAGGASAGPAADGAERGRVLAAAAAIARDLGNCPPSHLTATRFADLATEVGPDYGIAVEVLGPIELAQLGCGGLLGVNAGSAEEARLIKLSYRPARKSAKAASLALVGKGIMYDSGGISIKPSDAMHAQMKLDMSGAAAVFGAMTALSALECPNAVTAWLMCTDNMPSGSAMKLGDVLHLHGGKTVEVHNTDAEGRLVLADGLVLAAETSPDAIVDIATLTGACVVALGNGLAGVIGNNQPLVDRLRDAAADTDEPIWQLPLDSARLRKLLDSEIADIKNVGGPYGGAITAAIFLSEFVGDTPWAHLDIAPTMRFDSDDSWRVKGAAGFGARLLTDFVTSFKR